MGKTVKMSVEGKDLQEIGKWRGYYYEKKWPQGFICLFTWAIFHNIKTCLLVYTYRSQVSVYRTIGHLVLLAHLVIEPSFVDAFVLSNTNTSAISQPITIKFYQKHYWGGGQVTLGFVLGWKRTLVSMATDSSHRLTMGKHKKNLLRNFKAQSFHIL